MATGQLEGVVRTLRKQARVREFDGLPDAELLERYLIRGEADPFDALVRRHGPMVLGVCRRVLNHAHDAEDAFQATFLVLMRKAATIRPRAMVGNWLYGVAFRIAQRAKAMAAARRVKERAMARPETIEGSAGSE